MEIARVESPTSNRLFLGHLPMQLARTYSTMGRSAAYQPTTGYCKMTGSRRVPLRRGCNTITPPTGGLLQNNWQHNGSNILREVSTMATFQEEVPRRPPFLGVGGHLFPGVSSPKGHRF